MISNHIIFENDVLYKYPKNSWIYATEDGRIFKNWRGMHEYIQRVAFRKYFCTNSGEIVHRLVWECFYNMLIPDKFVIDYVDEDTTNNHISNLECISKSKNIKRSKEFSFCKKKKRYTQKYACSTIF